MSYKAFENVEPRDPVHMQITDINRHEMLVDDLDSLSRKYNRYNDASSRQKRESDRQKERNSRFDSRYGKYDQSDMIENLENEQYVDPYEELIESKNITIDELKHENAHLKQKLVDLSILYNSKLDNLRQEHRISLHQQHKKFIEKIKSCRRIDNSDASNLDDLDEIGSMYKDSQNRRERSKD